MQIQLEKLEKDFGIEWYEYIVGDLFAIRPTKNYGLSNQELFNSKGNTPVVSNTGVNNGITAYVDLAPTEKGNIITFSDTTTDEAIFYQPKDFIGYSHIQGMHKKFDENIGKHQYLFIVASFKNAVRGKYSYGSKFNRVNAAKEKIQLPTITVNGKPRIAFDFMDKFIATLNAERIATLNAERIATLNAYLLASGLNDYTLTDDEQAALASLNTRASRDFSFSQLFDHIIQGRRLKKRDQSAGSTPFIMAGVTNTGIAQYIGNDVRTFPENSLTVDIFGNVFYRSYEYGMGDDTGAYWSVDTFIPKFSMLYIATAMTKFMKGKFDFSHKLRSSRSLDFKIQLPIKADGNPDYEYMNLVILAMQKVVIKNLVNYLDHRIEKTKTAIGQ